MLTRRRLLQAGTAATTVAMLQRGASAAPAAAIVTVGIMGLKRGMQLANDLVKISSVRIKYVCDVDALRRTNGAKTLAGQGEIDPQPIEDFRHMLDDNEVDAIFCAAPNHWHGPATILACKAGKHVYCEKPASHNPQEGEWMIAAARKYSRCVQIGTQRRSSTSIQQAIQKIHDGVIGQVYAARADYASLRPSIGTGRVTSPPPSLNYTLWQGPAPHRPYQDNVVPYNWHWFWHWGNGELGNNGVHSIDICRWGLGDTLPRSATSTAGHVVTNDDQQTPDVQTAGFEMPGGTMITWQSTSRGKRTGGPMAVFLGSEGSIEIEGGGSWRHYDRGGKLVEQRQGSGGGQLEHLTNFIDAVCTEDPSRLNQPITNGHASTLLCQLGNIAHRTGRVVHCDAATGHIVNDKEQQAFWSRDYEPNWAREIRADA